MSRKVKSYPVVVELEDGTKVDGRCYSALASHCPVGRLPYVDGIMPRIAELSHSEEAGGGADLITLVLEAIGYLLEGVTIEQVKENFTNDDLLELWIQLTSVPEAAGVPNSAPPFTPSPVS